MKLPVRLLALLFLFTDYAAYAKSADNDAPVHIEADQVEMRERENISIYRGHVKITKGSIKITGTEITIKNKNGNLHHIKISGEPATFYQLNDLDEEISAESNQMDYMADNGMLELKENALLVKNQNRFSSPHIIYDTQKDIVKAGNHNAPEPGETPRVNITIHPEKNNKPTETQP